jgi:hypothetical protein
MQTNWDFFWTWGDSSDAGSVIFLEVDPAA